MNDIMVTVYDEFGNYFKGGEDEFHSWATQYGQGRWDWAVVVTRQDDYEDEEVAKTTVGDFYRELNERRKMTLDGKTREYRLRKADEKRTVVMNDTRVFNLFDEVLFEGTERGAYHWMKESVTKRDSRGWDNSKCTVEIAGRDKMTAREFLDMYDKKSDYARVLNDLDDIFFEGNEKDVFEKLETAELYGDISNWKVETADRGVMAVKSFLALKRKQKKMQNSDAFRNQEDQTMTVETESNFSLLNLIDLRRAAANFTAQIETVEESIRGQVTGDVTLKDKETIDQTIQDFQSGLDRYREKFFGEKTVDETDEMIRETVREEIAKAFLDFNRAVASKQNDLGDSDKKASPTQILLSGVFESFRRTYGRNNR